MFRHPVSSWLDLVKKANKRETFPLKKGPRFFEGKERKMATQPGLYT